MNKKSKDKLIVAVIVAIAVVGIMTMIVTSQIKKARNETFLNTIVLNIEPKNPPPIKITLDLRKSDEMLIEELTEAIEPLFLIKPIDEDAGIIFYHFKVTVVKKFTLRGHIYFFPRRPPTFRSKIGKYIRYEIRYVEDSPNPYRLSSRGVHTWPTSLPGEYLPGNSFKERQAKWIDHCTTAEYSLFKEMAAKEIVADCKTNFINYIRLLTSTGKILKITLEPTKE